MPERERDVWANYITGNTTSVSWDETADASVPTNRFRISVHPVCKRCRNGCKATMLDPPFNYSHDTDFCEEFEPLAKEKKKEEKNEWWDD